VREKHCSGWKNKLKKTDYKPDEQGQHLAATHGCHLNCPMLPQKSSKAESELPESSKAVEASKSNQPTTASLGKDEGGMPHESPPKG
jgi:hypothetical protein